MKHARADYQGRIVDKAGLIPEDEPVFVLRGQDELAASAVRWYAVLARNNGRDDIADAANRHADEMQKWHPRKLPDLPKAILLSLGVLFFGGDVARAQSAACDALYYRRNDFYDAKGLCFTRDAARRRYPHNGATCRYDSSDDLPLSAREIAALQAIRDREIELGCWRK
jgi:hypothetical protein